MSVIVEDDHPTDMELGQLVLSSDSADDVADSPSPFVEAISAEVLPGSAVKPALDRSQVCCGFNSFFFFFF